MQEKLLSLTERLVAHPRTIDIRTCKKCEQANGEHIVGHLSEGRFPISAINLALFLTPVDGIRSIRSAIDIERARKRQKKQLLASLRYFVNTLSNGRH